MWLSSSSVGRKFVMAVTGAVPRPIPHISLFDERHSHLLAAA